MKKIGAKIWILVAAVVLLLGIVVGVLFATGVFGGSATIKPDFDNIYFEFGKKINLPDTTVFDGSGKEIAYDSTCVAMVAPDGTEVDVSSGFVTPMQEGVYVLTYESVSMETKTEIKIECRDTINPTLSVEVPEAYLIKEKYEDTEYTVHSLPILSADDLAGIDSTKTEVKITVDGKEIPLNGDQFTITEEGELVFTFTVYDQNGLSTTVVKQSIAELPEYFDTYCLSTFAKDTYLTKLCGGWLRSYYETSILESDTDPSGNTMEGVLKITYDASDTEAGACIHLARPILLEEVEYLAVTLRLENAYFTDKVIDAVFYKSAYYNGFWTISNVSASVGSSYKTIYIGKTQLETFVEEDGYIRQFQIETFGDGTNVRSIYLADVSYGPKGSKMPENSGAVTGNNGSGGTTGNLNDDFPEYCLSTFAKNSYKNHMCGGWLNSKFTSNILTSDTDPSGKTMEGVVKITYPASDSQAGACIHLGRAVKRSDVQSIQITLRVENGTTESSGTADVVVYKSNYTNGYWTTSAFAAFVGKNYVTISLDSSTLLDKLTDSDGYIRQLQIETFGDGKIARSLYIADISYTPVVSEPDEPVVPDLPELPENCLSAFDSEGYLQMLCGGWRNSKYDAEILESDTDPSNVTKEGVLKITYPADDTEAGACVHLGKPVKRDEVKSLQVTLRLENASTTANGTVNVVFYKAGYTEGFWTISNLSTKITDKYVTISISSETLLDKLTDSDGYIRQLQIETFGDGKVARSLYIADISYTPVDGEPEQPLPEDALTINGLGIGRTDILYFNINVETGVSDWTNIASRCNEETHILINDKPWSTQELGGISGKSFYINNIGASVGTKITIKEGFTATFNDATYVTYQDYNYWWNGTAWTTEEVESPDEPTEPTEPAPENSLVVSGVTGQNPNQLMMSLPTDPNVKVGTKMTVQSGFTVTIDGVDYGTTQSYDFWWDGTAWTTEEVKPDQVLTITSLGAGTANILYFNINAETGVSDWASIASKCNEESHILFNDKAWGTQELGGVAGPCFYINNIGATVGTKLTIKEGFTAKFKGTNYITDKEYNYWWNGSAWTTEEVEMPEPDVPELPENCLSAFDSQQYLEWICGGWLSSKYEASILESDTDPSNVTKEGVLKITYPATDREAGACIHLAQPVKREDVKSIQVTLRIEGNAKTGGTHDAVFYRADYFDGYWSVSNLASPVGTSYVTINITSSTTLDTMTGSDGYISKIQIETFGDGKTARSIYIADISYTPVESTPVDPEPTEPPEVENVLVISGMHTGVANTAYFIINVETGLNDWTNIDNRANEEEYILIDDKPWSTQEIGAITGKSFYVNQIGGVVGTKITVKKGFSLTLNGVTYVTTQDYNFWWSGSAWTATEPQKDQILTINGLGAARTDILYFNINVETGVSDWANIASMCNEETHILINDQAWSTQELGGINGKSFYINKLNAVVGTKLTIKEGFTATFNGTKYVTDKKYEYWWNGTTWTTEEVSSN